MVHYYGRPVELNKSEEQDENETQRRCGVHRDFRSITLLFQDGVEGLEVFIENEWKRVPSITGNAVLLQFGWCAMFRSNGRLPAVRHRVSDPTPSEQELRGRSWKVKDRTALILFIAPPADVHLNPVVLDGEEQLFRNTTVGELKAFDGRNWTYREGTIKGKDREKRIWPTQDDAIMHRYFVGSVYSCFE